MYEEILVHISERKNYGSCWCQFPSFYKGMNVKAELAPLAALVKLIHHILEIGLQTLSLHPNILSSVNIEHKKFYIKHKT